MEGKLRSHDVCLTAFEQEFVYGCCFLAQDAAAGFPAKHDTKQKGV
jgi:hypothetical protein